MWVNTPTLRIYLARDPADMRRSFDGLCAMVRDLQHDPASGHLYVFRNKRGDRIKVLYFDQNGLAIWYKRLEQGYFHWPARSASCFELSSAELACLIDGIEFQGTRRYKRLGSTRR